MAQKRGKRFRAAYEKIDRTHHYEPAEAVALLKQTATARFDEEFVADHVLFGGYSGRSRAFRFRCRSSLRSRSHR